MIERGGGGVGVDGEVKAQGRERVRAIEGGGHEECGCVTV